jgi:DNA-binding transcriptional regulator GbsR (MarR family)
MAADQQWSCPQISDLANQIGNFLQYWGFKRVHGRIWTVLYLSKNSLDAAALRNRLKISKALVSLSMRDLLRYGVVQEVGKSRRGTTLYRATNDVRHAIVKVLQEREYEMVSRIANSHKECERIEPSDLNRLDVDGDRLKSLSEMISLASSLIQGVLDNHSTSPQVLAGFISMLNTKGEESEVSSRE